MEAAFFRRVGVSEKSPRHAAAAAIYVICFPAPACVCARCGSRREDRRRLIFYPSPAPQSGAALSPAICLPALAIVIPKYRLVHISLVSATSPTQHGGGGEREREREQSWRKEADAPCSLSPSLPFPLVSVFVARSLSRGLGCTMKGDAFYLVLHFICLIKRHRSFNKTRCSTHMLRPRSSGLFFSFSFFASSLSLSWSSADSTGVSSSETAHISPRHMTDTWILVFTNTVMNAGSTLSD